MAGKRGEADKLLDDLIKGKTPEEIAGEGDLLQQLTKRLYERPLAVSLRGRGRYELQR